MDNQKAIELLKRYHEVINNGNLDEFDHIFSSDFVNIAPSFAPIKGVAAMKKVISDLRAAFPDLHITVEDIFACDNKVATRWNLQGTHLAPYLDIPATGLKIYAEGIHIDHIVNNKVEKRWAYNNFENVFAKLKNKPR